MPKRREERKGPGALTGWAVVAVAVCAVVLVWMYNEDRKPVAPSRAPSAVPSFRSATPEPSPSPPERALRKVVFEEKSITELFASRALGIESLCPDGRGGVWIAASFEGELKLDRFSGNSGLVPALAIMRANDSGRIEHLMVLSSEGLGTAGELAPAGDGGVWLSGRFTGELQVGDKLLSEPWAQASFIARASAAGEILQAVSVANCAVTGISPDGEGGVNCAMVLTGPVMLGELSLIPRNYPRQKEVYALRLNARGEWMSAAEVSESGSLSSNPISWDGARSWVSSAGFPADSMRSVLLTSSAFDENGKVLRRLTATVSGSVTLAGASASENGQWLAGGFTGSARFGTRTLNSAGASNSILVARAGLDGTWHSAWELGQGTANALQELEGGVAVGGTHTADLTLGEYTSAGTGNGFVAFLSDDGRCRGLLGIGGPGRSVVDAMCSGGGDSIWVAANAIGRVSTGQSQVDAGDRQGAVLLRLEMVREHEGGALQPIPAGGSESVSYGFDVSDLMAQSFRGLALITDTRSSPDGTICMAGWASTPKALDNLGATIPSQADSFAGVLTEEGYLIPFLGMKRNTRSDRLLITSDNQGGYWVVGEHVGSYAANDQTGVKPNAKGIFAIQAGPDPVVKANYGVVTGDCTLAAIEADAEGGLWVTGTVGQGATIPTAQPASEAGAFLLHASARGLMVYMLPGCQFPALSRSTLGGTHFSVEMTGTIEVGGMRMSATAPSTVAMKLRDDGSAEWGQVLPLNRPVTGGGIAMRQGGGCWVLAARGAETLTLGSKSWPGVTGPSVLIGFDLNGGIDAVIEGDYAVEFIDSPDGDELWCSGRLSRTVPTSLEGQTLTARNGTCFIARFKPDGKLTGFLSCRFPDGGSVQRFYRDRDGADALLGWFTGRAALGGYSMESTARDSFIARLRNTGYG